ncbi:glutathione S-transferase C-terminal domain-containing protein [Talpa occidentalis]|uniref:glutathione S-transferase C-terminal domain-containing protein n=1 Tax=Talpa occidentalis TaxID=50954 RepID=UPI0018903747|nr:glutathione S-transferase C-terminal domain-containing protein [Talpa occidentalis]XP_054550556.1 glutathione S-transferase C-terminal domain-containing protein [Talpa occidentalis]XP_054550557.1 glutathione S-transferase C-terminal domain-containing protein [Talpa occidentalis]XP_054550558.1 glutathione S-transferase C-terminal domain-containing protein [Talpa occidentalis]XP_054550559.1 glutathione S-transferase C-terminal domain-containing protein [Talpa occidentalis]XP_054550560.1 gluta
MKGIKKNMTEEYLYLDFSHIIEGCVFPLHTSVTLFLLSYCDCKIFKVCLVLTKENTDISLLKNVLSQNVEIKIISRQELPPIVQNCCLPAVVERPDNFCRAGLAVILRHIIQKSYEADPSKKEILGLLGFKKTCLKACAEVSQWTRLCELTIPSAIENFLKDSSGQHPAIPAEIMLLENKLGEPVRVHNDDKLRRQKLKQQKAAGVDPSLPKGKSKSEPQKQETWDEVDSSSQSLELQMAFSKLTVHEGPAATHREPAHIRKASTAALPPLEHVFAEGLYFTLADIVLLPCIHQFLVIICKNLSEKLIEFPLLVAWYRRIQEVPRVKRAASQCGIHFLHLPESQTTSREQQPNATEAPGVEEQNDPSFVGGPRPTMTKLMEKGIEVMFSPHPCPAWTLDWNKLPAAVSPKEGKMSSDRALRKQQQLNNLVYVVTNQAKPGDRIVDFCSGGGHVGIVLAHMLPSCQVTLIENKELSLIRAKKRSDELGLSNIWFIQANMEYFTGMFNIGVALHACGVATDMVIEHCIQTRAAFVACPCCYGFIQNTSKFNFPKSEQFKKILSYKEHMILCRFADQTAVQLPPQRRLIGKQCMCLVDLDRARAAEERGYTVQVISMEPESCSPKNNLIVGIPVEKGTDI